MYMCIYASIYTYMYMCIYMYTWPGHDGYYYMTKCMDVAPITYNRNLAMLCKGQWHEIIEI